LVNRPTWWVAWVRRLFHPYTSFWTVRVSKAWSWVLRRMMDLRGVIRPFVRVSIGDGRSTHAWEDTWLDCGPLAPLITYRRIHAQGFEANDTVRVFLDTTAGLWPNDWIVRDPTVADVSYPRSQRVGM